MGPSSSAMISPLLMVPSMCVFLATIISTLSARQKWAVRDYLKIGQSTQGSFCTFRQLLSRYLTESSGNSERFRNSTWALSFFSMFLIYSSRWKYREHLILPHLSILNCEPTRITRARAKGSERTLSPRNQLWKNWELSPAVVIHTSRRVARAVVHWKYST